MPLSFDRAPLSIFKTIKSGTKLYLSTWTVIIIYGIFCGVASLLFNYFTLYATQRLNSTHDTLFAVELCLVYFCLVGLSIISIFLFLAIVYRIKAFVDKKVVTVKEVIVKAASKIIPTFFAGAIITVIFATVFAISATGFVFLISNISNWYSWPDQIWGSIIIGLSFIFYMILFSLLIRTALYAIAILCDEKRIFESIKYSLSLIAGWRNVIGTVLLLLVIQISTILGTSEIPALFNAHPMASNIIFVMMTSLLFPWSVACLVCWYWHLQKRGAWD